MNPLLRVFPLLFVIIALLSTACSGEDVAVLKSNTETDIFDDNDKTPLPEGPPSIEVTSHTDGQEVFGAREIIFAGTLTSPTAISDVTLSLNDADATVTWEQSSFSAELTLADQANTITITAENALGETTSVSLAVRYPFLPFTNGQAASLVIGQTDFTSTAEGTAAVQRGGGPWGNSVIANGKLYLSDYDNHRVLGYNSVPTENGASADFVLGQAWFGMNTAENSRSGMRQPTSISRSGDTMAIGFRDSNRVHLYFSLPVTGTDLPDVIVGQPDFDTVTNECTASSLRGVHDVQLVGEKLIVPDNQNHRVLIWDSVPTTNGAEADLVLGQDDFTTCTGGVGPASLDSPLSVWSDGERLLVNDSNNNRTLLWNTFPTQNGQAADVVLGQADLDANERPSLSASSYEWPSYVSSNGNQIFVADCGSRVLIWDSFPTTHGQDADRVLGEANFTDADYDTTASSLNCPAGFTFVGDSQLLIGDWANNRQVMFEAP